MRAVVVQGWQLVVAVGGRPHGAQHKLLLQMPCDVVTDLSLTKHTLTAFLQMIQERPLVHCCLLCAQAGHSPIALQLPYPVHVLQPNGHANTFLPDFLVKPGVSYIVWELLSEGVG